MTFAEERCHEFEHTFSVKKQDIKAFEGCVDVELKKDINNPCIYFTLSKWKNENYLNHYRASAFFKETWSNVRKGFTAKPEAWSLSEI